MAPKDYIAARNRESSAVDGDDHVVVMIDDRPYYPFLRVDANDHASIRTAVKILQTPTPSTTTTANDNNIKISAVDRQEHDHKSWPVTVVTGGITNQLFRVDITTPKTTTADNDTDGGKNNNHNNNSGSTSQSSHQSLLVRIFGAEGMIDRDIETASFAALAAQHNNNLAPPYWGRFANGRVEGWLEGMRPMTAREMALPRHAHGIAHQLARLHASFVVPDDLTEYHSVTKPSLFTQLQAWMDQALTATFTNPQDAERADLLLPPLSEIPAELTWLQTEVIPHDSKVAFCHNDLLAANILYNPNNNNTDTTTVATTKTTGNNSNIRLIDFEYGGMNFIAFDIANHFNEYAGGTEDGNTNYDWFPTQEHQMAFLKTYLECTAAAAAAAAACTTTTTTTTSPKSIDVSEDHVRTLYDQVQDFILANHLYWGLWAVNQAATEGCQDFDYLLFSKNRLTRYYECKRRQSEKQSSSSS